MMHAICDVFNLIYTTTIDLFPIFHYWLPPDAKHFPVRGWITRRISAKTQTENQMPAIQKREQRKLTGLHESGWEIMFTAPLLLSLTLPRSFHASRLLFRARRPLDIFQDGGLDVWVCMKMHLWPTSDALMTRTNVSYRAEMEQSV